ncbi:TetR/AcrR family transcriptional regulator [Actinomadura decatromicini]|uniref:TetR/AcrR family transcriptional regulator n=1 Tax=Actinomadura decatromicini TaxID=2604572 RepID=A0A5D3FRA6_9ACTN|nr:TetR/AcrR family transcriptional regulator [Actinomadura decatromicini]TYK50558.1 TetR/AcrR family transcriptional regulator [Actinomadura decatromicini]
MGGDPLNEVEHLRVDAATARPGGRTARVGEAVIDATIAELGEVGYAALRIDAVAERAGVNKSTIYRRWGTKAGLVSTAIIERRGEMAPPANTGCLRGDVVELLRQIRLSFQTPWIAALIRESRPRSADSAELYELLDRFWPARFRASSVIFERAVERGELPAGTDSHFLLEMMSGPLYFHLLMLGRPLDDAFLERTADFVLKGAGANPA